MTRVTAWAVEMMIKNVMTLSITGENIAVKREMIPPQLLRAWFTFLWSYDWMQMLDIDNWEIESMRPGATGNDTPRRRQRYKIISSYPAHLQESIRHLHHYIHKCSFAAPTSLRYSLCWSSQIKCHIVPRREGPNENGRRRTLCVTRILDDMLYSWSTIVPQNRLHPLMHGQRVGPIPHFHLLISTETFFFPVFLFSPKRYILLSMSRECFQSSHVIH